MKYIISETGEFPPQYKVLQEAEDGIWKPIFGPDPDLKDAQRKLAELQSVKKTVKKAKESKKETPKKLQLKEVDQKKLLLKSSLTNFVYSALYKGTITI